MGNAKRTRGDVVNVQTRTSRTSRDVAPRTRYVAWNYPSELETDVVVRANQTLHLRPIRPGDARKLDEFHSHLSSDSIYRRYFSVHPELSHEEVCHLTQVDYVDRLALVIEDGEEFVAVARYERYPSTALAEVAFLVRDDYQHLGLGHQLLENLARAAWDRGVTAFSAYTLVTNRAMISVFRHSGFPVTSTVSANEVSVRFSIEPTREVAAFRLEYRARTI